MASGYTLMTASDVIRDGLGVELVNDDQQTVAEVFRCDLDGKVIVSTFNNDIPLDALEELLSYARIHLEPFESGQSLDQATNFGLLKILNSTC